MKKNIEIRLKSVSSSHLSGFSLAEAMLPPHLHGCRVFWQRKPGVFIVVVEYVTANFIFFLHNP